MRRAVTRRTAGMTSVLLADSARERLAGRAFAVLPAGVAVWLLWRT